MATNQMLTSRFYRSVIDDVVGQSGDDFFEERIDGATLLALKTLWESKLKASKAIDPVSPTQSMQHYPFQQSYSRNNRPTRPYPAAPAPFVKTTPIQITVPPQEGVPNSARKIITVQVPANALTDAGAQLQAILSSVTVTEALRLPVEIATNVLQQHIDAALKIPATNPSQQVPRPNQAQQFVVPRTIQQPVVGQGSVQCRPVALPRTIQSQPVRMVAYQPQPVVIQRTNQPVVTQRPNQSQPFVIHRPNQSQPIRPVGCQPLVIQRTNQPVVTQRPNQSQPVFIQRTNKPVVIQRTNQSQPVRPVGCQPVVVQRTNHPVVMQRTIQSQPVRPFGCQPVVVQRINQPVIRRAQPIIEQFDGAYDTSDDEDDDYDFEDVEELPFEEEKGEDEMIVENDLEPELNSDDDESNDEDYEDPAVHFDTNNVVVCQYEKILRNSKTNKWKIQLKDGIMNINGRDYVFKTANLIGDVKW